MKLLSIALTAFLMVGTSSAFARDKPNIVFIFLDNFGWGEPGFNGGGIIRRTPTPSRSFVGACRRSQMCQLRPNAETAAKFCLEPQCRRRIRPF